MKLQVDMSEMDCRNISITSLIQTILKQFFKADA